MEQTYFLRVVFFVYSLVLFTLAADANSLVVSSTESAKENVPEEEKNSHVNPEIYSMHIYSNVSNRFVRTLITSKVRNLKKNAEETTFSVLLPENAFISKFEMEIKDKVYEAYVKEKEEAKKIYQEAVASGQSAAHVELNARDSKTFTVSVNIEPESKTIFRLVYEELLQRELGQYELVINIHPKQTVEDLEVEVHINESRPLTFVRTAALRTGNEISKNDKKLDPSAKIDIVNNNTAVVKFKPDVSQQKEFAENLGGSKENGIDGQFVVQYDVERDPQGGEVLVRDGYFVHFFSPSELQPLPKHIVFVLDNSGSMMGRKLDQLVEAMQNILSELKHEDLFNIIRFADEASVWDPETNQFMYVNVQSEQYGHLEPHLREANLPAAFEATKENIDSAKNIVKNRGNMGLTNIIAGLEIGLFLIKKTQEKVSSKYQPMIVFLTDGLPNVGISSVDEITDIVTELNTGTNRAAIFSLSFGSEADKKFLRKLSSRNLGFSRHIYEASDASLQLQDFYRKISSPLLSNITFKYVDGVSDVTRTHYPILFKGSELVVAGKIGNNLEISPSVNGRCTLGPIGFNTTRTEPVSSLERLWAYLTVKQLLKERESASNPNGLAKKALDLSLKYSFVTPVSSLVVVKPNKTDFDVDTTQPERPSDGPDGGAGPSGGLQLFGRPGTAGPAGPSSRSALSGHHYTGPMPAPQYPWRPVHLRPIPYRPYSTTRRVVPSTKGTTEMTPSQNATPPQWLDDLKRNDGNITTLQGSFKLGQSGDVTTYPDCPKTPLNGTGVCKIIFDCPQVFSFLTNISIYLESFCPLGKYAGVCCPNTLSPTFNF